MSITVVDPFSCAVVSFPAVPEKPRFLRPHWLRTYDSDGYPYLEINNHQTSISQPMMYQAFFAGSVIIQPTRTRVVEAYREMVDRLRAVGFSI